MAHGYLILSFAAGLFVDPAPGPLLANYGLALGCIRCTVVDIKTIPNNSDEPFLLTRAVVAAEGLNPETPVSN